MSLIVQRLYRYGALAYGCGFAITASWGTAFASDHIMSDSIRKGDLGTVELIVGTLPSCAVGVWFGTMWPIALPVLCVDAKNYYKRNGRMKIPFYH